MCEYLGLEEDWKSGTEDGLIAQSIQRSDVEARHVYILVATYAAG